MATKEVRGLYVVGSFLYAVMNNGVYKITTAGSPTQIGTITTSSGPVVMTDNGTQIIIVDGSATGNIITIATGAVAAIADGDFPTAESVTFQDGYFIVISKDTGKFFISSLYEGTAWDPLDFTIAEGRPDNSLAVLSNTHDLWIFGAISTEVYYNSGNADFPFARIAGALIDIGCGATHSPVKIGGQLYWLTEKAQVVRNTGYQYQFISTPTIDYQLSLLSPISDARGFTYSLDGHSFYGLTFPSANKTLIFDTTTNFWHEWQSYSAVSTWGRHRTNCAVQFNGNWVVGDYEDGNIYTLSPTTYTDNTNTIRRQRTTQNISKDRVNLIYHRLEIELEAGVGLSGGVQGEDPQAVLEWSDDGGHTWSNQHWRSIGAIGEYKSRAIWRRLGKARERIFRLTISDPVKVVILGAVADIEECKV